MENKRLSEVLILIGSNLSAIRMLRGLSLADLEKRTDLDLKTLNEIETGTTQSTVRDLLLISDALEIALPRLLMTEQADSLAWDIINPGLKTLPLYSE